MAKKQYKYKQKKKDYISGSSIDGPLFVLLLQIRDM